MSFILGVLVAALFLASHLFYDGPKTLSWPIALLIAILIPGAFGIAASYAAPWLFRLFRSRFWRFLMRFVIGFIGMMFLLLGVIAPLTGGSLMTLIFIPAGLWFLWIAFRGKDEDVEDFYTG